jgi:hypothetical protein
MRMTTAPERRVLLLQRAAVIVFGPHGSVHYLHTYDTTLGTTPAAAALAGGDAARLVGQRLRALALSAACRAVGGVGNTRRTFS